MSAKILWIFTFLVLYWAYCVFWGLNSARTARTAGDFFIAGRRLSAWVFVLAVTAASFGAWTFMGQPGLVYRDGFQVAFVSLAAVAIPLTGVVFFKRLWMLGKRHGYVTPGEMFSDYFGGGAMRILIVIIALVFAVPFVGIQLRAAGFLMEVLTDGMVGTSLGMWILATAVFVYTALGGLRGVAYVATLQSLLMVGGIVAVGMIAFDHLGGFAALNEALAGLGATDVGGLGMNAEGYNAYLAVPGVIQFTAGLGVETPIGGLWTGVMILTTIFALMGVQSSPTFIMWAFGSRSPLPFGPQQVWASAGVVGFVLVFFATAAGVGARFLGGTPAVGEAGRAVANVLPALGAADPYSLVADYLDTLALTAPWFVGLLAVCSLAAMQAAVASYLSTTGGMLTRDLYKRYLNPAADDATQTRFGRIGVGLVVFAALLLATYSTVALAQLGGLALAFGFQMWPPLAAVTWFPWITRQGATIGLAAGLITVVLTENLGTSIASFLGVDLPWGRWPWTIHSAGWGIVVNIIVCVVVSALTQDKVARQQRTAYHGFLAGHAGLSPEKRTLRPVAWALALVWLFFAIGPGAVIGNDLFGEPNAGIAAWDLQAPSIWVWQVAWWALGILMLWFLAYRMEMSTVPKEEVKPLVADIGTTPALTAPAPVPITRLRWFYGTALGVLALIVIWTFD